MQFKELEIIAPLQKCLAKEGFEKATEIQEKVTPLAISKKDILGCAQTGSGKTLAFVLPILNNMYNSRLEDGLVEGKVHRKIRTLILAPTRELSEQIGETFKPYCTNVNFKHTTIFGGVNDFHQKKAIEKGVDILIATPGRLMDLVSQSVVNLSFVDVLVLDESDRMLDMGNGGDISKIIKRLRGKRQTMLFSATMPKKIKILAEEILDNPEEVTVHKVASTTSNIKQLLYNVNSANKRQVLQQIVKRKDLKSILIFVRSRTDAERILGYVKTAGIASESIHKDKTQNQRKNSLKLLKNGSIKVLVATDIASRGLDIDSLSCVVNYDIPLNSDDYVHRIGRTGRAGKNGLAISIAIEADKEKIVNIEELIKQKLKIIDDDSYKKEVFPKERILKKEQGPKKIGRTNFISNTDSRWNKKKDKKDIKVVKSKKPKKSNNKKKRHYGK